MNLTFRQQHLRNTSRLNILVMLLMLFVVSGHCSVAMAQVQMPDQSAPPHHSAPVADVMAELMPHCSDTVEQAGDYEPNPCWDGHCTDSVTSLQAQSSKLSKLDLDSADLLAVETPNLTLARAGPCADTPLPALAEFSTPPLYYSLCVLRL